MKLQEIFIANLKYLRKKKGLTQNDLTLAIDKGYNYINGIEQGKSFPQLDVIEKIAEVLEIPPSKLFDENTCTETLIQVNREKIISEITRNLYEKLKKDIRKEVEKVISEL